MQWNPESYLRREAPLGRISKQGDVYYRTQHRGFQVFRETVGNETHFMVISYWSSRDAIHAFAGADIRRVHPLPCDPEFLIEPETTVFKYDIVDESHQ
jgi:heme-degrading monooxygenase HmoA